MTGIASAMVAAAALIFAPAAPVSARTAGHSAVPLDWSRTVAVTAQGGFRMGNPNAKVKLVEYGSLACPHCRHFAETGFDPLVRSYVSRGEASYEFRNLLINGPDIAISLLTRCVGPAKFFPMSKVVFDTQPDWQKRIEDLTDSQKAELESLSDEQRVSRFAQLGGMTRIAARFGLTPAQSRQCLADSKGLQRLLDMSQAATDSGISHTPTFLINGNVTTAATWEDLEPQLKALLGKRS